MGITGNEIEINRIVNISNEGNQISENIRGSSPKSNEATSTGNVVEIAKTKINSEHSLPDLEESDAFDSVFEGNNEQRRGLLQLEISRQVNDMNDSAKIGDSIEQSIGDFIMQSIAKADTLSEKDKTFLRSLTILMDAIIKTMNRLGNTVKDELGNTVKDELGNDIIATQEMVDNMCTALVEQSFRSTPAFQTMPQFACEIENLSKENLFKMKTDLDEGLELEKNQNFPPGFAALDDLCGNGDKSTRTQNQFQQQPPLINLSPGNNQSDDEFE
jgi:hypothetical protein